MSKARAYRSEIAASVHGMMTGLADAGMVDKTTMRQFDESCLALAPSLEAEEIRSIRIREAVSQPVFARYLNVSKNLVSDWERGVKRPGGPALRLLAIVKAKGLGAIV
jgi:putative transcriptional regulator